MKGYLSIREGDIICVPQNSTAMAKHMADLVSVDSKFYSLSTIVFCRFANRLV